MEGIFDKNKDKMNINDMFDTMKEIKQSLDEDVILDIDKETLKN